MKDHRNLITKAAFAQLIGVSRPRVTQMLRSKMINGAAVVGTGRAARIDADVAVEQIRRRRDPGQAMSNGVGTRLEGRTRLPPAPDTLECPAGATLALLRALPGYVAQSVLATGAEPWRAYAAAKSTRDDIVGLARVEFGVAVDDVAAIDWSRILQCFGFDDPVTIVAWEAAWDKAHQLVHGRAPA